MGAIGRNMTVFEYDGKLLIVDCGVLFPEEHHPGVDLILPDFESIRDRLDALFAERAPWYSSVATATIATDRATAAEVADTVHGLVGGAG